MGGLVFIIGTALLALFAYFLVGDSSPNANNQKAEIALKGPNFTTQIIILKNNRFDDDVSVIDRFMHGAEKPYDYYPIMDAVVVPEGIEVTTHYNQKKIIKTTDLYNELTAKDLTPHLKSQKFWLGTDRYGRSISSRLILGIRISLLVGLLAVIISLFVGTIIGAVGGYFGGWVDRVVMYMINVMWSIPTLLLVFAIVLAFGRGLGVIFLAVGLTMWVDVARIVRGQVKKIKEEQFVQAAKSMGVREYNILFRHILPNIIGPILVIAAANFATAILIEAGLSYLGFGVRPPTPSIGNMLNEHYGYAITGKPVLALVPAVTIMLMVLSFNLLGSGLRDVFDVKDGGK
ncbi:MAG: ABC-type dipeptide/oligopeptide/nickel transport system permease subunit [Saprospiraceae bacterium]|jgi:ABC-type dipeptide/oligopeptide/nickel transport system permease subunit